MSATAALPIVCAWCERVRTTAGLWQEQEPLDPFESAATHGICPDCLAVAQHEAVLAAECR